MEIRPIIRNHYGNDDARPRRFVYASSRTGSGHRAPLLAAELPPGGARGNQAGAVRAPHALQTHHARARKGRPPDRRRKRFRRRHHHLAAARGRRGRQQQAKQRRRRRPFTNVFQRRPASLFSRPTRCRQPPTRRKKSCSCLPSPTPLVRQTRFIMSCPSLL